MRFRLPHRHVGFVAAIAVTIGAQRSALDDRSVSLFLRELQRDVARDDRPAVSALIQYPLTVFAGGIRIPIGDAASLIKTYDIVFSPALKTLIAQASRSDRRRSGSTASVAIFSDVAIIGVNAIHIGLIGGALKITRITVPTAGSAAERAAGGSRAAGRAPQRLILGVGQLQRAGALARGEHDAYLLTAKKNQLLEVRINGVSGRDIVARITSITSRAPIDSRARDGVRTWIGRIPDDGEYRIEVVRLAAGDAPRLPYVMVVGLR
jgi:hypothetical protein